MDIEKKSESMLEHEILSSPLEMEPDILAAEQNVSTPLRDSFRRFTQDKRALVSLTIVILMVLTSLILPPIYQRIGPVLSLRHGFLHAAPSQYHTPWFINNEYVDKGPSSLYWLGTNYLGQDLLSRVLAGIQVSMLVAVMVVGLLDVGLGVLFGVLAGYYGGIIDTVLARFTDLIFAFPGLLFAVLITGIFGQKAIQTAGNNGMLILVSFTLGLTVWPQMARYVRGQTLQLKEQQFIEAARTTGSTSLQIIIRHILPNIASLVVVAATLDISGAVINEGVLSLLGLGVQPPGSSLGLMINESISNIAQYPYETLLPAAVLAVLVLCFSFIGDGMRDAFDPRTKD